MFLYNQKKTKRTLKTTIIQSIELTLTKKEKGLVKFHSYTSKQHSQQTKN
jgi:hypothetical protein